MFKWVCYFSGVTFGLIIIGLLFALTSRASLALSQSNQTLATVNEELPEMVSEAKKITHTLAMLSEDVNALKELAGFQPGARDDSLVRFANSLLDLLEQETSDSNGRIGLMKTFGIGLKNLEPVEEFVVGARREAALLVFRAKSKQEVLHRLAHNWSGKPFYLEIEGQEPAALEEWFRDKHTESKTLPEFPS